MKDLMPNSNSIISPLNDPKKKIKTKKNEFLLNNLEGCIYMRLINKKSFEKSNKHKDINEMLGRFEKNKNYFEKN